MTTETTTGADAAVSQPYVRVYAAENGDSRFADEELPLSVVKMWDGRTDATSEPLDPTEVSLRRILEDTSEGHIHPAPGRQFIVILKGEIEVEVTDGTRRSFGPGSIILMEDTAGNGHISRWVGSDAPLVIVLKLAQ